MKKVLDVFKNNFKVIKKSKLIILFILTSLINSFMLRGLTSGNILSIKAFLVDLVLLILLSYISVFLKPRERFTYFLIWEIIFTVICVINSIYYTYYSSYVSISLLATSVFVKDVGDAVVENVFQIKDLLYLIPFAMYIIIYIKIKKTSVNSVTKEDKKKYTFVAVTLEMVAVLSALFMLTKTDWSRFIKLWNRVAVADSYGIYTYQLNDIVVSLKPGFNNIFGHDKALKEVKEYYESRDDNVTKNKYTNIFEGMNVIAIHAESLQTFTLGLKVNNIEITPNLNKLSKEGLFFNNFYAQVGVGTSSDSEFTYSTSMMPSNNGTVFVNYYNNEYSSIQKLLVDKGYYTFSMHGNVGDFWNRQTMHKNLGYKKFYSKSSYDIDEVYGLGLSDKSFFRQSVPKIKEIASNNNPFYGLLITLTNHTPWPDTDKYSDLDFTKTVNVNGEEVTRDYLEGTTMGYYLKAVNYMDSAFGEFISALDKEGLLDNTVVVIYGDHDARIGKKYYDILYNYDPYTDSIIPTDDDKYVPVDSYRYELNRKVPFIIWTKNKKFNQTISTPMGMIDVLPTLGNMLNIRSKYQLGNDVMSIKNGDNTVVFKDGSYLTNKIYYNSKTGEIYPISNEVISEDYISKHSDYASQIIDVSNNIITYNLLKELETK